MNCRGDFVMCVKGITVAVLNKICVICFTI